MNFKIIVVDAIVDVYFASIHNINKIIFDNVIYYLHYFAKNIRFQNLETCYKKQQFVIDV